MSIVTTALTGWRALAGWQATAILIGAGVLAAGSTYLLWRNSVYREGYEAAQAECQKASDQNAGIVQGQKDILARLGETSNAEVANQLAGINRRLETIARAPKPTVVKVFPAGCKVGQEIVEAANNE